MRTLLDTNVLLRAAQPASTDHVTATRAVASLLAAGRSLCISSQTIYEFLAVATRPVSENGLGLKHADADRRLDKLLAATEVLYDSEPAVLELRKLV